MQKKRIRASEVLKDIQDGFSDDELVMKYGITPDGLQSILEKMIDADILTQEILDGRNRVFFTADTHFGCRSQMIVFKRPFEKVAEMDKAMIDSWNEAVRPQDTVYHLGDFGIHRDFGPDAQQQGDIHTIFQLLNGRKILIMGNHDEDPGPVWDLPWAQKTRDPMIIRIRGQEIWLTHYPPKGTWPGKDRGGWCLYGHVHGRRRPTACCFDVGVDCWDFRPVEFSEIQERMESLMFSEAPSKTGRKRSIR